MIVNAEGVKDLEGGSFGLFQGIILAFRLGD
jgi:hypothetical protein